MRSSKGCKPSEPGAFKRKNVTDEVFDSDGPFERGDIDGLFEDLSLDNSIGDALGFQLPA